MTLPRRSLLAGLAGSAVAFVLPRRRKPPVTTALYPSLTLYPAVDLYPRG